MKRILPILIAVMLSCTGCYGLVGDSLTRQANATFDHNIWEVSASDGRPAQGSEAFLAQVAGSPNKHGVVIALGTNDAVLNRTAQQMAASIDSLLATAGSTCVVWIDVKVDVNIAARYPHYETAAELFNSVLASRVRNIASWNAYQMGHPEWFIYDGLHLTPAGAQAYQSFIDSAARQYCPAP